MAKAKKIDYTALYTRRKDGRYQTSYTDDVGRRQYVYDTDPERLWHRMNDPKEDPPATFRAIAEAWQAEHWERIGYKTAEAYTAPLARLLDRYGPDPADSVTASAISAYLSELAKQGFARRSVQMHRDILNMIYNHAIVTGVCAGNPCSAVTLPRNLASSKRELPSDEAIEAVKNSADVPFSLFAQICLYAGLRRGEVLALRYEDIDLDRRVIHVQRAVEYVGNNPHIKGTKTKAGTRDVVLLDKLAARMPKRKTRGYIFAREDGRPLTKTQYRKRWTAYCQTIGYDITAHQLRHGYATILYEAGIPDKDAQELLGHSNITVTRNIYTHIRQTRRQETAARLNAFLSAGDTES